MEMEKFYLHYEDLENVKAPANPFSPEGAVAGWGFTGGLAVTLIIGAIVT